MTEKPKKTTRDLSDLKARLGLAKPAAEASAPTAPAAPASPYAPQAAPSPYAPQAQAPGQQYVPPPPGIMPPPGMAQPAPQAPPPDVRRDPFSGAAPVSRGYDAPIVDAGPAIEIPKEKRSSGKLLIAFIIVALIPLGVGWACGRIYASRVLFNNGIRDAGTIKTQVEKMAAANKQIAEVLHKSRLRNNNQIKFDDKLIEELKDVLRKSPDASADRAKKRQDELFRTNYAMMEGIVIDRLFNYFNNTIRLMGELEMFIRNATESADLLKTYSDTMNEGQRKYGIVFAEDAGSYYLGQLVEVGDIACADEKKAANCPKEDIKGFQVRTGVRGSWSPRPGKPDKKGRVADIVIPIIPDEFFRQVVVGRPGYLAYKEYVQSYSRLSAIAGLLSKDEKELVKDLGKAAGRPVLFVF